MIKKAVLTLSTLGLFLWAAPPPPVANKIIYKSPEGKHHGYIAYPSDSLRGKLPAVLVVHEWWGQTDYPRKRADMLAENGIIALAVDMYGEGQTAGHPKDAGAFSKKAFSDAGKLGAVFQAALDYLKKDPRVNPQKISAIGYCFGGAVVLEMARQGKDLSLVASFHGSLNTPTQPKPGDIKARVLVFNGADDKMVSEEAIKNFKKQMEKLKVDYMFKSYPGAKHGFTNPEATKKGKEFGLPLAYHPEADKDSWEILLKQVR